MDPIYELQVFGVFWNLSTPLILLSFWSAFFCCFFLFPSLFPYLYNFFISSPPFPSLQDLNFSFHPPHYTTIPPPLKPHGRRGPRAAPRAGTPAPSRGAPWRAAARPRRPRRRSTPWLLQKLRSERTSFMFFIGFFTIFENLCFFGRFGQLQTRGHASPHALSIGAGPSARGVQGFGLLDETLSKHRSMISMDLNDSNDFNDLNDSWILAAGVFLEISFFRSLSLPRFLSFPAWYFLWVFLLNIFVWSLLKPWNTPDYEKSSLVLMSASASASASICALLNVLNLPLNCCMFMCVRVLSKLGPPNNVGRWKHEQNADGPRPMPSFHLKFYFGELKKPSALQNSKTV